MPSLEPPFWIGDRQFQAEDLELIEAMVRDYRRLDRTELAATIAENLPWKAPNGRPKLEACRLLLESLEAAGRIEMPQKRRPWYPPEARRPLPEPIEVINWESLLETIRPVTLEAVPKAELGIWNATVAAHHPLGYQRPFGAHQRYWIKSGAEGAPEILGAILFGPSAKALATRDRWIGWDRLEQQRFRHRIVGNGRFLILPGIRVPHLASHILGLAARQLPHDWKRRYGYEPVLLETFVEKPWAGTCYRAANWIRLGETAGRGRQDRHKEWALPVKQILVYPLFRDWRERLVLPQGPMPDEEWDDEE